jgi:SAM-dependent methyltransferase
MAIHQTLIEQWKNDEMALFKGWDFSYIKNRKNEEQEPWNYETLAIEGYKPNVAVARDRLEHLGVKVLEVDESCGLPLTDSEFDLVLNKHSAFMASEVFRVLKSDGIFLTQQVGGDNLNDLISFFDATPKYISWTRENMKDEIQNAGFKIKEVKDWKGKVEFKDVGAIVYFLKAIPWIVEGFSVETHARYLEQLQEKLERNEKLIFTQVRFLVFAQKP